MIGYMMKNGSGEYLSMDGGTTTDWFKASKFDASGIKQREIYLKCGYELITFEVSEINNKVNIAMPPPPPPSTLKPRVVHEGFGRASRDFSGYER